MLVDLVQIPARDGVRLDGVLQLPPEGTPRPLAVDAFCLLHGTGGNFYGSSPLESLAARLLGLGSAVLRANTRGHDGVSTAVTPRGGRRLGAAYEVVDDCRHDIAGLVAWLRERIGPRVGLVGHSLGAVKCLYAAAHESGLRVEGVADLRPACVVAVSPPRLSYSWFCESEKSHEFLATYAEAERHVEAGRPEALLDVKFPLPFLVTAAGYLEKYGPAERYNFQCSIFSAAAACPVLATFGGDEIAKNVAFRGSPEMLREMAAQRPQLAVEVIGGADHFYTGKRQEVCDAVEGWLRRAMTA